MYLTESILANWIVWNSDSEIFDCKILYHRQYLSVFPHLSGVNTEANKGTTCRWCFSLFTCMSLWYRFWSGDHVISGSFPFSTLLEVSCTPFTGGLKPCERIW